MSVGEAYRLAHLLRQSEHQPTFSISAKTLPCIAAEDIEISAADRGVHWPGNSGRVEAKILEGGDQYQAQIKVGPFFCAGSEGGATVHETCRYQRITLQFAIRNNPYY